MKASLLVLSLLGFVACKGGGATHDDLGHVDAGGDAAKADTQGELVTDGKYSLLGQTTAGLLIALDSTKALYSVDPTTGTATMIAPKADGGAFVNGNVVFVSHDVDANMLGGLGVWTQASGYHDLGATAANAFNAYTDGTHIAYEPNFNATTFIGDMVIDTVDHAGAKTLFTQQSITFFPSIVSGKIIVGHAAPNANQIGTITSYDLSTGTGTDLLTSVSVSYTMNAQNTALVAFTGTSSYELYDLATADTVALPADVQTATFSADGKSILASTTANALEIITWSGTTATAQTPPLLASGVSAVSAVSGDGKRALYYANFNDTTFTTDLQLVELATPTMHSTLAPSGVFSGSFSPDSSFVLFETNVNQTTFIGTLQAVSVTGTTPATISTTEYFDWTLSNDLLLVQDNASTATPPLYDLELANLNMPAATSTKLLKQVDEYIIQSNDGKTAYFTNATAASPGIYKLSIPSP